MHANFYNIMLCNILGSLHISMHSDNWTPTLRALDETLEMLLASRVNEMHALLGDLLRCPTSSRRSDGKNEHTRPSEV